MLGIKHSVTLPVAEMEFTEWGGPFHHDITLSDLEKYITQLRLNGVPDDAVVKVRGPKNDIGTLTIEWSDQMVSPETNKDLP